MSISSLRSSGRESQLQRYVSSPAISINWRVNPAQGQQTTPYIYPPPRRRFASQYIPFLSTQSLRGRQKRQYSVGLGQRTVVVRGRAGLPKMAMAHPWLSIPPASLPRLYTWHSRSRYARTFPSFSSHHPI